jgi:hypothetical protein
MARICLIRPERQPRKGRMGQESVSPMGTIDRLCWVKSPIKRLRCGQFLIAIAVKLYS